MKKIRSKEAVLTLDLHLRFRGSESEWKLALTLLMPLLILGVQLLARFCESP